MQAIQKEFIPYTHLPFDVTDLIFQYLNPLDLGSVGRVCKQYYRISHREVLWKKYFERFPVLQKQLPDSEWRDYVIKAIGDRIFRDLFPINNYIYTASGYEFRALLQKRPQVPGVYTFRQKHIKSEGISCFCAFNPFSVGEVAARKVMVFTGNSEFKIMLWSIYELNNRSFEINCDATLVGHKGTITSLKLKTDHLFSTSEDKTIRIWKIVRDSKYKIVDIKCIKTIFCTNEKSALIPECADPHGIVFYSGSVDHSITQYKISPDAEDEKDVKEEKIEKRKILTGHQGKITGLAFSALNNNCLSSCSSDGTIKIWHPNQGSIQCSQTINAHQTSVTALIHHPFTRLLISGSAGGEIAIWIKPKEESPWVVQDRFDVHNCRIKNLKFGPHTSATWPQSFYSLSIDNTVKIWEKNKESEHFICTTTIPGQLSFLKNAP